MHSNWKLNATVRIKVMSSIVGEFKQVQNPCFVFARKSPSIYQPITALLSEGRIEGQIEDQIKGWIAFSTCFKQTTSVNRLHSLN